jgi:hypothetical protein
MARKPKISNIAVKGELALSDLHIRLNLLRKQNEKLLKQIKTARTNLRAY